MTVYMKVLFLITIISYSAYIILSHIYEKGFYYGTLFVYDLLLLLHGISMTIITLISIFRMIYNREYFVEKGIWREFYFKCKDKKIYLYHMVRMIPLIGFILSDERDEDIEIELCRSDNRSCLLSFVVLFAMIIIFEVIVHFIRFYII